MSRPDDPSTVSVHLADPADAPAVADVLREAFAEYESLYTPAAFVATTPTADHLRARWADGPVWLVRSAGVAVGTVAAVPQGQGLYVRSMAVRPTARGLGVGRLLLDQVEAFARRHRHPQLILSSTPFLHMAIRLYERFGFTRTADGPAELLGTPLLTMTKTLSPGDRR